MTTSHTLKFITLHIHCKDVDWKVAKWLDWTWFKKTHYQKILIVSYLDLAEKHLPSPSHSNHDSKCTHSNHQDRCHDHTHSNGGYCSGWEPTGARHNGSSSDVSFIHIDTTLCVKTYMYTLYRCPSGMGLEMAIETIRTLLVLMLTQQSVPVHCCHVTKICKYY
jgi:hypothetical protein